MAVPLLLFPMKHINVPTWQTLSLFLMMDKVNRVESFLSGFHLFKHLIHHIDGLDFLAVDNFRIYLRGAHIGVSHQFAGGINVCPDSHHHRSELTRRTTEFAEREAGYKRQQKKLRQERLSITYFYIYTF